MTLSTDVLACARIVESADPHRFRAAMVAPLAARTVLFPLYAFNVEVSRAPWVTQEPMIAEMRLQWWRDVADEIGQGGPVRRHEVATPLAEVIAPDRAHLLDALVAARSWDIHRDPFEDHDHLATYIDATAGNLVWAAASALGPADEHTVRDAACAAGIAAWLCAVAELEARGRIPLVDGTPEGVRRLARSALDRLARARRNRGTVSRAARPALNSVAGTTRILRAAARDPARVADGRLTSDAALAGFSLALRTATGLW
ncbi:squalene/phytoene synthase family protein [Sulfitobacter sp. D35]|uniref:squalene/phytoene synthase family protein n=1 Tax=Sulfitobacter sp. D35 TaxID=3083252 RepID=UPI00296E5DE8|nr:squalene/phytoene synthase family protein [Sulfitobacter sp. D35]MDW4497564.1 squalene/phytoene synthase family protein [Sulfitobacter sp. D35]